MSCVHVLCTCLVCMSFDNILCACLVCMSCVHVLCACLVIIYCVYFLSACICSDDTHTGPALFGMSWDSGNASTRRAYTPILISVGNTDYGGYKVCTCVGYMPSLNLSSKDLKTDEGQQAIHELKQECAKAIIGVIERCAQHGFTCVLNGTEWHLYPVLAKMEFDTKERYRFFGCARERACGIGSGPRQSHSTLRTCTPHSSRHDLGRKRKLASGVTPPGTPADVVDEMIDAAADSLRRRGIHPRHQCTALQKLRYSVLRWPGRIHYGLFTFDVLHIINSNYTMYLQDALLSILKPKLKKELDRRVCSFTSFRKPHDGSTSTKVSSLTKTAYITAELRVLHLFIWSHAIGSKAGIFPLALRDDVLIAIRSLQIICFAVRRKRPYTEAEHRYFTRHTHKDMYTKICTQSKQDMHTRHAHKTCTQDMHTKQTRHAHKI